MKVSKSQLKQIIKEESLKLNELFDWLSGPSEEAGEHGTGDDKLAWDLYRAMKGMGTNDELVAQVFRSIKTAQQMKSVTKEFDTVLVHKGDTGDGGLAEWLIDDGLEEYAQIVKKAGDAPDKPAAAPAGATGGAGGGLPKGGHPLHQQVKNLVQVLGPDRLAQVLEKISAMLSKQGQGK